MNKLKYLRVVFSQTSTWRGVVSILTAIGIVLTPDQTEAVIALGLGISGVLGTFFPDDFTIS